MAKPRRSALEVPKASAPSAEATAGLHIVRYHTGRSFALYDGQTLLALTVYRKGAEALKARLEEDARTIADLQSQLTERTALTPRFREQATETPYRPPEQLPLLAAEAMPAYRQPTHRRPAPR